MTIHVHKDDNIHKVEWHEDGKGERELAHYFNFNPSELELQVSYLDDMMQLNPPFTDDWPPADATPPAAPPETVVPGAVKWEIYEKSLDVRARLRAELEAVKAERDEKIAEALSHYADLVDARENMNLTDDALIAARTALATAEADKDSALRTASVAREMMIESSDELDEANVSFSIELEEMVKALASEREALAVTQDDLNQSEQYAEKSFTEICKALYIHPDSKMPEIIDAIKAERDARTEIVERVVQQERTYLDECIAHADAEQRADGLADALRRALPDVQKRRDKLYYDTIKLLAAHDARRSEGGGK